MSPRNLMLRVIAVLGVCLAAGCTCCQKSKTEADGAANAGEATPSAGKSNAATTQAKEPTMQQGLQLGNFSVSLAVKDLAASKAFYEKLGFKPIGGDASQNWLILQNDTATIGLFQGMFDRNILTFNPGWDRSANTLAKFEDVRDLQKKLMAAGITPVNKADENSTGPASFVLVDPDGNPVLVDQHVPKP